MRINPRYPKYLKFLHCASHQTKPAAMNMFRLSYRNLRMLAMISAGVVTFYVFLNSLMFFLSKYKLENVEPVNLDYIPAKLKFGPTDANGQVQIIASFDVRHLIKLWNDREMGVDKPKPVELVGVPPLVNISLHNSSICNNLPDLQWIIYVISSPERADKRNLLRATWADVRLFRKTVFKVVFLIGKTSDESVQQSINEEFQHHQDIIQGNFEDTNKAATLKGVLGLKWVSENCRKARYALKVNDDSFINIFMLMKLVESKSEKKRVIMCPLWQDNTMLILRDLDKCGAWCVKDDELPGRTHFPQYCAGTGIVSSMEVIVDMYQVSLTTPFFWIDDVYITGILPPKLEKPVDFVDLQSSFSMLESDIKSQYLSDKEQIKILITQISDVQLFQQVWRSLMNRLPPSIFNQLTDSAIARHV